MSYGKKEITVLVMIDLSAAFDTVKDEILLQILEKKLALCDTVLRWFMSYLENQKCKLCIGNDYSEIKTVNFSVPQGGILSPCLFNSYSITIDTVIPSEISINAFADDYFPQKSIVPCKKEEEKTMNMIESTMNNIDEWMGSNQLKINASKTELILYGTNYQLKKKTSKN